MIAWNRRNKIENLGSFTRATAVESLLTKGPTNFLVSVQTQYSFFGQLLGIKKQKKKDTT